MKHQVSVILFSKDHSHVLVSPFAQGEYIIMCLPMVRCEPGEGFRTAASRLTSSAIGIDVDASDWQGFHQIREHDKQDRVVHFFTAVLPELNSALTLEQDQPFWMPVRQLMHIAQKDLLRRDGHTVDATMCYLLPLALLTVTSTFRNMGY